MQRQSKHKAVLLLAHGAGAGKNSEFLVQFDALLEQLGIQVKRFNFPYMDIIEQTGKRRPPNPMKQLQACYAEQITHTHEQLALELPLFIGGKSMGGRVASMIVDDYQQQVAGCICLGYPFHPPGKPDKLRTEHLQKLASPLLIIQGERDSFGSQQEVAGYALSKSIRCEFLADADHSFKPRVKSGFTLSQHLSSAASLTHEFIHSLVPRFPPAD